MRTRSRTGLSSRPPLQLARHGLEQELALRRRARRHAHECREAEGGAVAHEHAPREEPAPQRGSVARGEDEVRRAGRQRRAPEAREACARRLPIFAARDGVVHGGADDVPERRVLAGAGGGRRARPPVRRPRCSPSPFPSPGTRTARSRSPPRARPRARLDRQRQGLHQPFSVSGADTWHSRLIAPARARRPADLRPGARCRGRPSRRSARGRRRPSGACGPDRGRSARRRRPGAPRRASGA